jgi:UDP-sulfoquinovose synthase
MVAAGITPTNGRDKSVRIMVLGADGYLGWPTSLYLSSKGHDIVGVDNFARRAIDVELGSNSLVPILTFDERIAAWREVSGQQIESVPGDLVDPDFCDHLMTSYEPDAVVHFAEQRSAPYSMIDRQHAVDTQVNNVVGTLNLLYAIADRSPDTHLVKLGTLGEYGTPNVDIEEGWLQVTHNGRTDRLLYPKRAGSFYHLSKVHDSHNIEFACRIWGLRATDLNQGIVYGQVTGETALDARLATRLDYDAVFGTVLNRFIVQAAIGQPLTVYGTGGQTRGMLDIRDTVRCVEIACEHPADPGEFRVFNQFTESFSIQDLADMVTEFYPGEVTVHYMENPRVETEDHYYNAVNSGLIALGLKPHLLSNTLVESMFEIVEQHAERVRPDLLLPRTRWRRQPTAAPALRSVE